MERSRRTVVTGLGPVSPNGIGVQAFWENSLAGKSGIRRIEAFSTDSFKSKIAGQVSGFMPTQLGLSGEQVRRLERCAQFGVACTNLAVEDAGLQGGFGDGERVGVCIANAISGTGQMETEFLARTARGQARLDPLRVNLNLYQAATFNTPSAEVAAMYGLHGPCFTVSTGCTAGLDSIGFALNAIRYGEADMMICGAVEAPITPIAFAAFDVIGALSSKRNDDPERASRPFELDRDGFVLGEGGAVLILEEREHALLRGARIYAEVCGFGSCNNAFHMTDLPPCGTDLAHAIELALANAELSADTVDYVSAHGSSTRQNDVNETAAFKRVFGARAFEIPASSLKSMIGHPLAAANSIESVAAVMSLFTSRLHPTINYDKPDPACDLSYVPNRAIERPLRAVLKTASGFSGIHSAVVFASADRVEGAA
ncbi:MAG: beta-ketoacyl-[acyl-carrier-protein] synthase family protein [Polyangia bacterium]